MREDAGLTQAQLAKRVTFSPASICRIESGERKLTGEEFDAFLSAIGTDRARRLGEYLGQDWDEVERPGDNAKASTDEPARRYPKVGDLSVQILTRMDLLHRNRRDDWYVEDGKPTPMQWLQNIFREVNNGRHPQFSLPERIDVVLPDAVFSSRRFPLSVIDTKGIDQTAERQDLENLFDDPRTLVVLCSKFYDAPEVAIQALLRRAKDAGGRNLEEKAVILVLPRPDEAVSVKDDHGCEAESDREGYALKRGHIDLALGHLGLPGLPVVFYNAKQDAPGPVRDVLIEGLTRYRKLYGDSIDRLSEAVDHLIDNRADVQVQMVFGEVERRLTTWIEGNRELDWDDGQVQGTLLTAIASTRHASTIRASVNRSGEWPNLDFYHHLGYGARRLAVGRIGRKVEEFKIIVQNAIDDEELAPARMFLGRVVGRIELAANEAYLKIQEVAREAFRREVEPDQAFWWACRGRWGRGPGYREDIRDKTDDKLGSSYEDAHLAVRSIVLDEWSRIVGLLEEMLDERQELATDSSVPCHLAE